MQALCVCLYLSVAMFIVQFDNRSAIAASLDFILIPLEVKIDIVSCS